MPQIWCLLLNGWKLIDVTFALFEYILGTETNSTLLSCSTGSMPCLPFQVCFFYLAERLGSSLLFCWRRHCPISICPFIMGLEWVGPTSSLFRSVVLYAHVNSSCHRDQAAAATTMFRLQPLPNYYWYLLPLSSSRRHWTFQILSINIRHNSTLIHLISSSAILKLPFNCIWTPKCYQEWKQPQFPMHNEGHFSLSISP